MAIIDVAAWAATVVVMTVQELAGAAGVATAAHSVAAVVLASASVGEVAATAAAATETAPEAEATGRPAKSMSVALMAPVPVMVGVIPATAELISASVASRTRSLWLKMQPGSSSSVSQLLPLAVGSPI